MSRSDAFLTRRSFVLRAGVAGLAAGLLAACGPVGEGSSLVGGQTRLDPLVAAPPAGRVTVQFLPFTGAPVTIADGIYQRIRTKCQERGIDLVNRLEEPASYRIQGHFVALGGETATTVIFTYEIFDTGGRRVHRIVGQEVGKPSDGDPWSSVDTETQTRLANRAVQAVKAWLTRAAA